MVWLRAIRLGRFRMTGEFLAIGVDPGPTPGIVALRWSGPLLVSAHVIQCTHGIAPSIVTWLLAEESHPELRAVVQTERFVVGRGSGKSAKAGAITRDLVGAIEREVGFHSHSVSGYAAAVVQENASRAKAWATDVRLDAVRHESSSLLQLVKGMTHARDGARHALFASVQHGGVPDPLSRAGGIVSKAQAREDLGLEGGGSHG